MNLSKASMPEKSAFKKYSNSKEVEELLVASPKLLIRASVIAYIAIILISVGLCLFVTYPDSTGEKETLLWLILKKSW